MLKKLTAAIATVIMVIILASCGNSAEPVSSVDPVDRVVPPEDFVLAGDWQDETSQRAAMTIFENGDKYDVEISWANSADETVFWNFSGEFDRDRGFLSYKDCMKTIVTEESEDVEYEDGTGSIMYLDGNLIWQDDKEDAGADCVFVKVE